MKLVQAATLKSSVPLQVARSALIHTVQVDANVSSCACEDRVKPSLVPFTHVFFFELHSPTCSSPPAGLDHHPVAVQPWAAAETQLSQSYAVQVVQFMSDEPHHQVNQQQGSTHNRHHHATHRAVWLQSGDSADKMQFIVVFILLALLLL